MNKEGLGTNTVAQIALVVNDIERSRGAWADVLGMPLPEVSVTAPREETDARYRGEPTEARAKLAFFQMENITIELIEPVGEPSTWHDFLREHGEGVHHIAFRVEDGAETIARLDGMGMPVVQQGGFTNGRYTYFDSIAKLGVTLELLERRG